MLPILSAGAPGGDHRRTERPLRFRGQPHCFGVQPVDFEERGGAGLIHS